MKVTFSGMDRDEIQEAACICSRALSDNPFVTAFFPDREERDKVLSSMFYRLWLTCFKRIHFIAARVDGKMAGVALFESPGLRKPSSLKFMLHGWSKLYRMTDRKRIDDYLAMQEIAFTPCQDYHLSGHGIWFCSSLFVDPEYQHKGIGSQLIYLMGDYIRMKGGKQLTLTANTDTDLHFCQKRGFEVFHERELSYEDTKTVFRSLKKLL